MWKLVDYPVIFGLVCFLLLWLAVALGFRLQSKRVQLADDDREDLAVVTTATLTLLGLIIGFTFSMAVSRYDLRKHYEAEEANSIGTEYNRIDMLAPAESATVHELLKKYLDLRIQHYEIRFDTTRLREIEAQTEDLQRKMWSVVANVGATRSSATIALVVAEMNQVIDNQGYAQAAWLNRIPRAAWILLVLIAICGTFLVGFSSRKHRKILFIVLPGTIALSLFLIADIDCPRHGVIPVRPDNLRILAQGLRR